jgi:NitT/TauT family transport system substrate-binding protein
VVGNIGDFGLSYSQWLVTDEKWLGANQQAAAGVAAAIEEANKYVTEHPQDAAAITEKAIKIPQAQTLAIMRDLKFVMRDFTPSDLAQAKRSADFFVQRGTIKSTPDIDTTVLRGFYTDHVGN